MTKLRTTLRAAALVGFAIPGSAAVAQALTGTSHPDEVVISTTPDGVRQPVVYVGVPPESSVSVSSSAQTSGLKVRTQEKPSAAIPESTFVVVGPTPDVISREQSQTGNELRERQSQSTRASWADGAVVGDQPPMSSSREQRAFAPDRDPDANIVTRVEGPANTLPQGTLLKARMLQAFSTQSTSEGSEWKGELIEPVTRDGHVLIPAGAVIRGKVTEVRGGRRIAGGAAIHLEPFSVTLPDGSTRALHAQVCDTSRYDSNRVDQEGTILRRDEKKKDAGILALTAGSGAAAGAMIAGPPGALVGAGLGAGVTGIIWLKQDRQTELPRDTVVTFELTRPMSFGLD